MYCDGFDEIFSTQEENGALKGGCYHYKGSSTKKGNNRKVIDKRRKKNKNKKTHK